MGVVSVDQTQHSQCLDKTCRELIYDISQEALTKARLSKDALEQH